MFYDDTCDDAILRLIFSVTSLALIRDISGTYNPQAELNNIGIFYVVTYNKWGKQQGLTIIDLGKILA